VPAFAVRAALGELSQELLGSRRVVPRAALSLGHTFTHDEIESALAAELGKAGEAGRAASRRRA
jgi:NAD dependent epimerase/dehydratase family enzyme